MNKALTIIKFVELKFFYVSQVVNTAVNQKKRNHHRIQKAQPNESVTVNCQGAAQSETVFLPCCLVIGQD